MSIIYLQQEIITPWLYDSNDIVDNETRSININRIRRFVRSENRLFIPRSFEQDLSGEEFLLARRIREENIIFPPIRATFDRIWRDFIFPGSSVCVVDTSGYTRCSTIDEISNFLSDIRFNYYFTNMINPSDIDFYKYCVIVAAFNCLYKIYINIDTNIEQRLYEREQPVPQPAPADLFPCFPVFYVTPSRNNRHDTIDHSAEFRLKAVNFIRLFNSVPTPRLNSVLQPSGQSRQEWKNFWAIAWHIYINAAQLQIRRQQRRRTRGVSLLMEEYMRREIKNDFITKDQIIEMISNLILPENVLNTIFNILSGQKK